MAPVVPVAAPVELGVAPAASVAPVEGVAVVLLPAIPVVFDELVEAPVVALESVAGVAATVSSCLAQPATSRLDAASSAPANNAGFERGLSVMMGLQVRDCPH